ncbi:uncharacterized protein LOC142345368 [Convolutriloba macropyga]|uniref:uncharacterized protein LOC142345368 n=1 Tax=Convolutriloba macropyga TaxID=536237 RepID=UPI003F523214
MLHFKIIPAFFVLLLDAAITSAKDCKEKCPLGFQRVHGLKHCYRLLIDLGPVSHDKGVAACGFEKGATLVTFDHKGDDQILRNHFFKLYGEQMKNDSAYWDALGFWTGYIRKYGSAKDSYVNMYSGDAIDKSLFRHSQPNNLLLGESGEEACLCRKEFGTTHLKKGNGLDDYPCAHPHWIICMHRDVFALNMRIYNSALNDGVKLPENGDCELDWVDQNYYQFKMMREKKIQKKKYHLADLYLEVWDKIGSPECPWWL